MKKKQPLILTEENKEFVKDLSRKLVVRSYLVNSARRPKTPIDVLKSVFIKKPHRAPVIDILDVIKNRK